MGVALSSCVGKSIGKGNIKAARLYSLVCFESAVLFASCFALLIYFGRDILSRFFSTNPQIISVARRNLTLIPLLQLPDCFQVMLSGVVRGLGLSTDGRILAAVCVSMFGVMQISGIVLAFGFGMMGRGLIIGAGTGLFVQSLLYCHIIYTSDWLKCVEASKTRQTISTSLEDTTDTLDDCGRQGQSLWNSDVETQPTTSSSSASLVKWNDSYVTLTNHHGKLVDESYAESEDTAARYMALDDNT